MPKFKIEVQIGEGKEQVLGVVFDSEINNNMQLYSGEVYILERVDQKVLEGTKAIIFSFNKNSASWDNITDVAVETLFGDSFTVEQVNDWMVIFIKGIRGYEENNN